MMVIVNDSSKKAKVSENVVAKEVAKAVLEGAEELLAEWGFALNELAFKSRAGFNDFKEIETSAATHWLKATVGDLPEVKTAYGAAVKYRDIAEERSVIQKGNFKLEEKGDTILGTFMSEGCPYKECCISRKEAKKKYLCFRTTPFIIAIKLMSGEDYKSEVLYEPTDPGKVCVVRGLPTEMDFIVGLSYKLGKGSVKIHEVDCDKIGIGLIDNVTIKPSRKELAGRKLTVMAFSQTKFPVGMIVMNVADAKALGLMEKDTVHVVKAGEEETVSLVEEHEYESPELEVPEEKTEEGAEKELDKELEDAPKEMKSKKKEEEALGEDVTEEEIIEKPKAKSRKALKKKAKPKSTEEIKEEPEEEAPKKEKPKKEVKKVTEKQINDFEDKIDAIRKK